MEKLLYDSVFCTNKWTERAEILGKTALLKICCKISTKGFEMTNYLLKIENTKAK